MTAYDWKEFYRAERESLSAPEIERFFLDASSLSFTPGCALIFPHTRLGASGALTASVVRAVVEARPAAVLALGVLHGARRSDAEIVARARSNDREATRALRGVHGPDALADGGIWTEEFSLDNFCFLLDRYVAMSGLPKPQIILRYPFLTGTDPCSLPGYEELERLAHAPDVALVATTDPVHHGVGYGTSSDSLLERESQATLTTAREMVERQLAALATREYAAFLELATQYRSDFRDNGPVLAELLRREGTSLRSQLHDLTLVDYFDVLGCRAPTWVAASTAALARA